MVRAKTPRWLLRWVPQVALVVTVVGCKDRYQPLVTVSGAITATADDLRTGFYPNQPKLGPAIVGGATFGRLWKTTLPLSTGEQVFAQPLFANGAVFVATLANNIYSLDGDTGAVRASRAMGTPWRTSDIGCGDITPTVGITGTPVIDDAANVAYFLSKTYLGDAPVSDTTNSAWLLHAVDVSTLAEQANFPVRIQGVADNDQTVRFDPFYQMQRTGLLLMNGVVYAGFGSHCDFGQYEGWVVGVGTDGVIKSLFATETGPGAGRGAGIWQAGGGLVSDGPGRIFFATGNHIGAPNMTPAGQPTAVLGQSVVRLDVRSDATLAASDYFSPADRQMLDAADVDLGSGAPVALPAVPFSTTAAPNLMIAGGKSGVLYVLDRNNLGGFQQAAGGGDAVLSRVQVNGGGMWSRPAVWPGDGGYIYVVPNGAPMRAFRFGSQSSGAPTFTETGATGDPFGYTSGSPIVTADGANSGTALVWVLFSTGAYGAGQLRAYDAVPDASQHLVLRYQDSYGTCAKFSSPGVGDGRIYVGSGDGAVLAYGAPLAAAVTAPAVVFGQVVVGTTATATVTLTANRSVTITALAAPAAPFAVGTLSQPLPATLASGATLTFPVTFNPAAVKMYAASLAVSTSAGPAAVSLAGIGQAAAPVLNISNSMLSFGGVPRGATATVNVLLSNAGSQPLSFTGFTMPASPFSVTGLPAVGSALAPGASLTVTAVFSPTANGAYGGSFAVTSTGGTVSLAMTGNAGDPPVMVVAPSTLTFLGAVGASLAQSFTVANTGGTPLTITKSKPPARGVFVAQSALDEGTVIPAGQSRTETIAFLPTTTGTFSDQWIITGNDSSGVQVVNLSGTAVTGGDGLLATYFDQMNLTGNTVVRIDPTVNFLWGAGSPAAAIPVDRFSARWTGQVQAVFSETYTFYTLSDDGIRLWVNGQVIVDNWTDHGATENSGSVTLAAGQLYDLRLEFYENCCDADAILSWSSPSTPKQVVPQEFLFSGAAAGGPGSGGSGGATVDAGGSGGAGGAGGTGGGAGTGGAPAATGSGDGLSATYFSQPNFGGQTVTRIDPTVNFLWGAGSPDPRIPVDNFSARWVGQVQPSFSETYTFFTFSDDGVRLWVNGQPVIDNWTDHAGTENAGSITLSAGQRYDLRLEFYENCCDADAVLSWSSPSTPKQVIPQSALFSGSGGAGGSGGTTAGGGGAGGGAGAIADAGATVDAAPPPAPDAAPPSIAGSGLSATYFTQKTLTGNTVVRIDPTVNFNWGNGSPDPQIPVDNFSARWTGQVMAPVGGPFTFFTVSDDGVRLWVGGLLVIDNWTDHAPTENSGLFAMTSGQAYDLRMEFYENAGGAEATLSWSGPSTPKQIIPSTDMFPTIAPSTDGGTMDAAVDGGAAAVDVVKIAPSAGAGDGLLGTYFSQKTLAGSTIVRVDPTVNFDWGAGSPDPRLGVDNFSVRWTGQVQATFSEPYTFYTTSDDGVRLWVNGVLLVDDWTDHGALEDAGTISLIAGNRYDLRMEFYENAGDAIATLSWSSPSVPKQIIPQASLYSGVAP